VARTCASIAMLAVLSICGRVAHTDRYRRIDVDFIAAIGRKRRPQSCVEGTPINARAIIVLAGVSPISCRNCSMEECLMRGRTALLCVLIVHVMTTRAHASPASVAREHFLKGTKAFDLGHYDEAVAEYEAAYTARDDPAYLYNIAQAQRLAGRATEALRSYRAFLRRAPGHPARAEVEAKIATLRTELEQQNGARPPSAESGQPSRDAEAQRSDDRAASAPVATPPPSAPTRTAALPAASGRSNYETTDSRLVVRKGPGQKEQRARVIAGLSVAAVGACALFGGLGTGVAARQQAIQLTRLDRMQGEFDAAADRRGRAEQAATIALVSVGGAAVVVGTTVALVSWRRAAHGKETK
jgi:tetratricopeptide (TPR) repeat protein